MLQTYLQLAGLFAGILSSLTAIYVALRVKELHVSVNSRLTELLKTSGAKEQAEGREEGRQEPR